jgi:hypothetical protein
LIPLAHGAGSSLRRDTMPLYPGRPIVAGRLVAVAAAALAALLAVLAACTDPLQPAPTPITSAGDPTAAVPFRWALSTDGVLRLQGGNLHAIASEVRLLDAGGKTAASAPATLLGADAGGLCGEPQAQGMVGAELRLPDASGWPDQYRLEVKVGDTWRPAQLTRAC